ncbi:unnamed protein product, partial [Ceratitis capitata]
DICQQQQKQQQQTSGMTTWRCTTRYIQPCCSEYLHLRQNNGQFGDACAQRRIKFQKKRQNKIAVVHVYCQQLQQMLHKAHPQQH